MIKGIIFDLDGVIVSTDKLHYKAWKNLSIRENIHFDEAINHQLRGISRMDSLEIILTNSDTMYSMDEKKEMAEYKNNIYKASLVTLSEEDILPGVIDVLNELKKRGKKVAIGSSSKNAKQILERIGLIDFFDAISDGTNITRSKPDPEVFLKAAEMLKLPNFECAVIEDALSGIEAAKACNMITFAVGDARKSQIKDYDFDEILKIIK